MDDRTYDEGMCISRNFEKREDTETQKLYDIIAKVIAIYQRGEDPAREKALVYLTKLFEPLLRKTSTRVYNNLRNSHDYNDVLQETHTMFYSLLGRYNAKRSAFSYYISVMLPQHMNRWAERELLHNRVNIPVDTEEYSIIDPTFNSSDAVQDHLNAYVLTHEYQEFIKKRALRHSRSVTVSEVCNRYFLGSDTCSEIAQDLGISYHAVYEIIGKIKKEIQVFFQYSIFSGYMISSTGIAEKKLDHG